VTGIRFLDGRRKPHQSRRLPLSKLLLVAVTPGFLAGPLQQSISLAATPSRLNLVPRAATKAPRRRAKGFGTAPLKTTRQRPKGDADEEVRRRQRRGEHSQIHEGRRDPLRETSEKVFKVGNQDVRLLVPSYVLDLNRFGVMIQSGAGTVSDIVWPAEQALTEVMLQRRHLWEHAGICELGAGLGLAGIAAAMAGAPRVLITDRDDMVLQIAAKSATLNAVGDRVSTSAFDWADTDKWPSSQQGFVIAADVLYDRELFAPLIGLVQRMGGQAMFMEPVNAERLELRSIERFEAKARARGMNVHIEDYLPTSDAPTAMKLLHITSMDGGSDGTSGPAAPAEEI